MADTITVKVKVSSRDQALEIPTTRSQSVEQFKRLIAAASDIPADRQRLIFRGKLLKDTDTLESAGVENDHTIHVAPTGASAASAPAPAPSPMPQPLLSAPAPVPIPSYSVTPAQDAAFDQGMKRLLSNPEEAAREAVTVLHKIVSNVHDHPMEEKYRGLKKSNATFHRKIGGLPGGVDVLKAVGFTEQGDDLTLFPSPELWPGLVKAKQVLDSMVQRLQRSDLPRATPVAAPSAAPAVPGVDAATLQQFLQGLQQLQAQQPPNPPEGGQQDPQP